MVSSSNHSGGKRFPFFSDYPDLLWGTHSFLFSECWRVENCTLLGYYTTSHHNFLLTFQDKLSVQSLGCQNPKESLLSQHRVYYREEYGQ